MESIKTVYGTICNHGQTQTLEAVLPSGKRFEESGDITDDIDNNYETDATDADGTIVKVIAEWKK